MITVFGIQTIDYRLWRLWSMDYHEHKDDIMDGIMLNNTKYQLFKKKLNRKNFKKQRTNLKINQNKNYNSSIAPNYTI